MDNGAPEPPCFGAPSPEPNPEPQMPRASRLVPIILLAAAPAMADEITFRHPLDNKPLEFEYRPDQEITPAVETFHETGENPYAGDEEAIAEGKKLYAKYCQACHLPDGTGRIGPSLVDDEWKYERADTEVGRFEIIYAGAAGAMQAFGQRIDQDAILKVMAYIDALAKE